jgi:hypothetical protein
MRDLAQALVLGLLAPIRRPRLVFLLWLARLVPIVLFFSLPLYDAARKDIARQPQARALLDAPADESGFSWAWTNDFFATRFQAEHRLFWLFLAGWLIVCVLAGGLVAALLHGREPIAAACGRYGGRMIRLGLIAAALLYVADAGVNGVLEASHEDAARVHHTQDFEAKRAFMRAALFTGLAFLIGVVHSYARIDLIARGRRSAFVAFGRALGILLARLPKLLVLEGVMLLAAGAAAALAYFLLRIARPGATAGWASLGVFLVGGLLTSYLRTGVEMGTLAARCRLLVQPPLTPVSPFERLLPEEPPTSAAV